MADGQYTLDADPMTLARRVQKLEECYDRLSGCLVDLTRSLMVIADQCDKALCEDRPLQAWAICAEHERLTHVHDSAHGAYTIMGRSY